ncbi:peroxidasin-like [Parasteatoda tepidariorum]|uniref:peroxidasin-like n=1 Tax=Parasteatoda tepidariorum TaxID=114398 RepID=UPI00077FA090|nr:connectin-like [Parasteatoda tepidariorum]
MKTIMKYSTIILFLFCLSTNACPRKEDLYPCTCDWQTSGNSASVTCVKLENDQDLLRSAKSLIGKSYVNSIVIQDSAFNYIASDTFKGLKFAELEIRDSTLMALTDSDVAFKGLEEHLETLKMDKCVLLSQWDWSIFRNLKKLNTLEIKHGALESIEDLGKINLSNLKRLSFPGNRIDFIHDDAFSDNKKLVHVFLNDNNISTLKRTMFPNPASELQEINLNYNEIGQLPDDIFSNMPKLKNLSVGGNKILVLNEKVFSLVWRQLDNFEAFENELRCDCRMTWILQLKQPNTLRATCANPQVLKGKSVSSLTSKDLWCIY